MTATGQAGNGVSQADPPWQLLASYKYQINVQMLKKQITRANNMKLRQVV